MGTSAPKPVARSDQQVPREVLKPLLDICGISRGSRVANLAEKTPDMFHLEQFLTLTEASWLPYPAVSL